MAKLKINRLTEDEIAQYVAPIETRIKYTFHNKSLLYLALIHRSFVFETPGANSQTNERLEFLGDAVLAYAIRRPVEAVTTALTATTWAVVAFAVSAAVVKVAPPIVVFEKSWSVTVQ